MNLVWSVFTGIGSLLSRKNVEEFSDEEYKKVLFSEKEEPKEVEEAKEEVPESICQTRIGTITKLQSDYGLIDHKYYFDLSELKNKEIKEGEVVNYIAYRYNANSEFKVKEVTLLQKNEWDLEPANTVQEPFITGESVVKRKKMTGNVIKKNGRILTVNPQGVDLDLNKVKSEFLPVVGDWVEMVVIIEIKEDLSDGQIVEVEHLKPLLSNQVSGNITSLDTEGDEIRGIINSEVYFTLNVCESGYNPQLNDTVVANVIESTQGSLTWRAINVIPVSKIENDDTDIFSSIEDDKLFDSKNGISISIESERNVTKIREELIFEVSVTNNSDQTHTITDATLHHFRNNDMVKVCQDFTKPVPIAAKSELSFQIKVKPVSVGNFTELITFSFEGDFKIRDLFAFIVDPDIIVEKETKIESHPTRTTAARAKNDDRRLAAMKKTLPSKKGFIVPGVRPIKPASFIPNRLDLYPIPSSLTNIFISEDDAYKKFAQIEEDIAKIYPCMVQMLDEKNYLLKFHNLLHIEDLEMSVAIKKYDRDRASFDRKGEYLSLEIPNLAESRPSLVIGDKLIASDPAVFKKNGTKYEGFIHKVLANSIYLKFNESFHASYNGKDYSVTFVHSRTGIRRCHQAINLVHKNLGHRWLFPDTLSEVKRPQVNIIEEIPPKKEQMEEHHVCRLDKYLSKENSRNNDDENLEKSAEKVSQSVSFCKVVLDVGNPKDLVRQEGILKWVNSSLNQYQKEAVRNILKGEARPLPYVIFGPPGTGKTVTVVETILQITQLIPYSRILVATPSNSSADLICDRLLSWDVLSPGDLVRIVGYNYMNDDRMPAHLKPYCTVVNMRNSEGTEVYEEDGVKYSTKEEIGRHRITVGTCVSVGILYTMGLPRGHFTHVIIDEAGQAMEPEILIPLAFVTLNSHSILAGDPRQLGPVITSKVAENLGLGESLLSRFLTRFPYHRDPESYPNTHGYDPRLVTWLLYNYRSLPEILGLYSNLFYDSKLLPKICDKCSEEIIMLNDLAREMPNLRKANGTPTSIIFHGVRGVNAQEEDSPSWFNDHEVITVIDYIGDLYRCKLKSSDVGIITPYQKQVQKIRDMLKMYDLDLPKVGSVEEFQGQERKVIILSTVRSDEGLLEKDAKYALGFVASKQRLNVAISRARCLLVIIGNPHLLVKDISWRNLLKTCIEKNCYVGCDLPNSVTR